MLDILPIFSKLFKASQSDSLDYDKFGVLLALTRDSLTAMDNAEADGMANLKALLDLPLADGRFEYHGVHLKRCDTHVAAIHNQKSQFLKELLAQLERRFPRDGMALLQSLHKLFNLRKVKAVDAQDVTTYGKRELESVLLSHLLPFFFPSYYILLPASNFQHCVIIYFTPYH